MDFDLNKDPHIDLKADISHSDELLRSIPLEVLEGAQSAQKESFMMRLQVLNEAIIQSVMLRCTMDLN